MAFLNVRAFECVLCGGRFTLLCADFIMQESLICDTCLVALWPLQGVALQHHIAGRLAGRAAGAEDRADQVARQAGRIAQHVVGLRQRWGAVEALIQDREAGRRAHAAPPGDVARPHD